MGRAYDFAFRPILGDPEPGFGGGCDTRPHRAELFEARADPGSSSAAWQPFQLCEDHEGQLRTIDVGKLQPLGIPTRFRSPAR